VIYEEKKGSTDHPSRFNGISFSLVATCFGLYKSHLQAIKNRIHGKYNSNTTHEIIFINRAEISALQKLELCKPKLDKYDFILNYNKCILY
jgi:hypothetical protein